MGYLGAVSKLVTATVALVAVALARYRGDPDAALRELPVPVGAFAYVALGGEFPPIFNSAALRNETQFRMWARPGDVMVAACPKCGTTWMMNIVHQLRVPDNRTLAEEFVGQYDIVPWPLLRYEIGDTVAETLGALDAEWWDNERYPYRAFKTQSVPDDTPVDRLRQASSGNELKYRPDLKYIVVVRNPYEQFESALHFFASANPELVRKFNLISPPPWLAARFFVGKIVNGPGNSASHLQGWKHHLRAENVLLLHFTDLKRDPERWLRRTAEFVGATVPDHLWPAVQERVSLRWMKAHNDKWCGRRPDGICMAGNDLVRSGKSGEKLSLATEADNANLKAHLEAHIDLDVLDYVVHGGDEYRRRLTGRD